jgi:NDP-sugar pyrophosphorylase family protein
VERVRTLYQKEIWIKVPRAENFAQARRIIAQHVHHIKNKHARERALVFLNTDA